MSFPEEPLNLPPSEGGGYFPAQISQKLANGKYTIVRKLGYGPRSSVWLVSQSRSPNSDEEEEDYFAVKIYTTSASERAKSVELPILKTVNKLKPSLWLPIMHRKFWEKTGAGLHLCLVLNPMSTSVRSLQKEATNECLPVHTVQHIVRFVAVALGGLHAVGIMHGAVKPENVYFSAAAQTEHLKPVLESDPAPKTTKVGKYTTVHSQPLAHPFKWNEKRKQVDNWGLFFDGFGHAQQTTYEPEKNYDYSSAPETLIYRASCSPQTDIWMLGVMTYTLLTGSAPFLTKPKVSKTIAHMGVILDDPDSIPESWLSDPRLKDYAAVVSGQGALAGSSIETNLVNVLSEEDAASAADFIKACLRLDPEKRPSAKEISRHEWLAYW